MPTVIETLGQYETHLIHERRIKPNTLRRKQLALKYFTELL